MIAFINIIHNHYCYDRQDNHRSADDEDFTLFLLFYVCALNIGYHYQAAIINCYATIYVLKNGQPLLPLCHINQNTKAKV